MTFFFDCRLCMFFKYSTRYKFIPPFITCLNYEVKNYFRNNNKSLYNDLIKIQTEVCPDQLLKLSFNKIFCFRPLYEGTFYFYMYPKIEMALSSRVNK